VLINTEGIGPNYEIVVDRKNHSDILIIKVEVEAESMMDSYAALERLEDTLKDKMRLMLGLDAKIQLVSPNTLQRFEGKAKRVTDLRKSDEASGQLLRGPVQLIHTERKEKTCQRKEYYLAMKP
jgi:phenylacetate-CoA ligase